MPTLSSVLEQLKYDSNRRPLALQFRSSRGFIVSAVAGAVFTDIFLYAVIVPVVPFALQRRVGVKHDEVQKWVSVLLAIYAAALLVAAPVCGWAADRMPTRRASLLFGLLMLSGATILLCIGNSIPLWITGRLVQGVSAAIVWTAGLALLVDTVGQKDIGQSMGYVSLAMSSAVLLGPLLGGVVYNKGGGYYSVFIMCFVLLGIDIALRVALIEKKIAAKWLAVDAGAGTVPGAADQPADDKQMDNIHADTGPVSAAAQGEAGPSSLAVVVPTDAAAQPPPPNITLDPSVSGPKKRLKVPAVITLLTSTRLLASLWGSLVQAAILTALDALLTIRVRHIFGWTSLGAGLLYLPVVLPSFVAPVVGHLSDRHGPRWYSVAGFLLAAPFLVLLRLVYYDSLAQKALMCVLLAAIGFSVIVGFTPLMAEITYCVESIELERPGVFGKQGAYAQGYALFNVAFAAGCCVGPIWGGLIKQHAGWDTATWTLGLLSATSALPAALWCGGWVGDAKNRARRQAKKKKGVPAGDAALQEVEEPKAGSALCDQKQEDSSQTDRIAVHV